MAHLERHGSITRREIAGFKLDPRRFCATDGWLQPIGDGKWVQGKMPRFDLQHPDVYPKILAEISGPFAEAAP
jgi:hypothetical protein